MKQRLHPIVKKRKRESSKSLIPPCLQGWLFALAVSVTFTIVPDAWAESYPLWIKPVDALTDDVRVWIDGQYAQFRDAEYVKGKRIPLANWMGDWPGFSPPDGEAYIQIHSQQSPIRPSRMYIGVKIPRFWDQETGDDHGEIELYFAFNEQYCPQNEDRQIRMSFSQPNAPTASVSPSESTVTWDTVEYKGDPSAGCLHTKPLDGTAPHLINSKIRMDEFDDGVFLFAEFEIALPANVYTAERLRFGLKYKDRDYGTANCPRCCSSVLTLPNDPLAQGGSPNQLDWGREGTYQLIDLKEPVLTELGVSAYNVGQMLDFSLGSIPDGDIAELADVFVDNGGIGGPEDIAEAIWSRDIVCLSEVMMHDDRKEIVHRANKIRASKNLPPFLPVMKEGDDSPNVMILSWWWPITKAEVKKYSELDPDAGGPDDLYFGSTRGAKGVVWARLGPPPKCKYGPPNEQGVCPENADEFDSHQWIDVFCTHTQAPCSPTPIVGSDTQCQNEKDHHLNATRQKQFQALGKYIQQKRSSIEPFGSGFDRPALLLGDLNQVGPRSRSNNWGNDGNMDDWRFGNQPSANNDIYWGPKLQIALAYEQMRRKLDNWFRTDFDKRNADEYITGYDLTADTNFEGSWIGKEHQGQTGESLSYSCTPGFPDLRNEARVDYIMLIPATVKYPSWAYRWAPGKPHHAQVDRHLVSFPTGQGGNLEGCVSDHAEVFAHIQLVPVALPESPNPYRDNRFFYSVAQLDDVNESDDTWFDDGTTDWYTNKFYLETSDDSPIPNVTGLCQAEWGTNITPAGKVSTPGWKYRSYPMKGKDTALVWLEVSDYDSVSSDYYDSHSRSPCKHTEVVFKLDGLQVIEQGCGMGITRVMDKGKGLSFPSKGNGDDGDNDVQINNIFRLCEINQDPGCDLITGP